MIFAVWRHRVPVPPQRRSDHRLQAVVEIWTSKILVFLFQETNKRPTHTQIDLKIGDPQVAIGFNTKNC
jgi:hypothetical protein